MAFNNSWTAFAEPNITGFYDAFKYYNTVTDNIFGGGLLIGIYGVLLLLFSRYGIKESFSASSFIMFVLSLMLRSAMLVGDTFPVFFALATAVSMLLLART